MSYLKCVSSLGLRGKIPAEELKASAAAYQEQGIALEEALQRAVSDKIELLEMEERRIVAVVRKAYEAAGGKARPVAAPVKAPPKQDTEKARAQADLMAGLADLADIFGKNAKLNITPEQEQKLVPVLARVMDAALRLGYYKFKDAARFVHATILEKLGADVSDQISLDHLQGAYISMAGKYQEQGADTKKTVINDFETLDQVTATDSTGEQNDPTTSSDSPEINQPLDEGRRPDGSETVTRGAKPPRARPGRADGGSVRKPRGRSNGTDDAKQDLGDTTGIDAVSDGPADDVARSDKRVSNPDYRPGIGGLTREGSWFDTAKRNIDLIDLAIKIESEKRGATPAEQEMLSKYVGFGASAIRNPLFPIPPGYAKSQDPNRLIWPQYVQDAKFKPLAERIDALPREWQKSILQSSQYAHYTSEGIVRSVWSAMQRMGFTGGKVFEPGMGIGSFSMLMPDSVRKTSQYTGVEFDGPTALIARLLQPEQNMLHDDFIKRKFPKDFFDVAIGNPPFSQTKILGDPDYEKQGFMLHDFFFAKSIDRVRPGGLLAFVTSKGTMDKQTDKARKYLSERADLVGAIRLPSTAFEDNAGTSVVTDVIFLRKRMPGEAPGGQPWNNVATIDTKDGPAVVNEYFAAHPEMVLGQQRISGNTDDQGRRINSNGRGGEKYTVVSYDTTPAELDAKFAAAIENLPENMYSVLSQSPEGVRQETAKMDFDPSVKREGVVYAGKDGTIMRVEHGVGKPLADSMKMTEADIPWFKGYVGLRDMVQATRLAQVTDGDWEASLKKLNTAYDKFRKEHGPINAFRVQVRKSTDEDGKPIETESRIFTNRRRLREDYDSAILTNLETINEAGEIIKSPFLMGRTIGKPATRDVKTVGDSLAVSLDSFGKLDLDDVGQRIGLKRAEVIDALGDQIYKTPAGDWQMVDEYLSGDVVTKLEEAEQAARLDPNLRRNVEALKKAQPEKLGPSQISAKLGASWVPAEHVNEFAKEIGAGAVTFDSKTETWQVVGGNLRSERVAGAEYGTASRSASELLESALNSRSVKVMTKDATGKVVADQPATDAANEVLKKIKDKFKGWVWTDTERATELVESYNNRYNNIAARKFDGSHLTLPGVSLRYKLHPHQLRAIWRMIQTGNTYLAHAVGAGKTIEMIAGGMEQKRLGLIKKPMYVVPNHMLEQFSNEFMELYPLANIMVADDENFSADRRKAFIASATMNNPDAIIITHDAFQRIGVKEESVAPIRDEILADLEIELEDAAKDAGARVRRSQLEQQIEAVTQRFDRIVGAGGKDSTIKFEDIGVDFVFADEAHVFRKLDFHTAQQIKGIDPNGSKRSLDMYVKTRWLEKQRPGRSMAFASGTPVTNTMGEIYTIMRFFAADELNRAGISTFDAWSRQFGEVVAALEPNAAGKYELIERFARFDNVPELMSRVRQFMDVLTSDNLGALVKRPDLKGGKPNLNIVAPSESLNEYQKGELARRIEISKAWKPSKDEPANPDPIVAIITDGRFAAIDPRFFGGTLDEDGSSIIHTMADKVVDSYQATKDNIYFDKAGKPEAIKGSTQIVFYNLGFGEQSQKNRGFSSRNAFTKRLMDGGIPRDQIAWFDDANSDAKKEAVFKDMRSGKLKVLIGSAKKMGTGVNVQKRLAVLHYQDPPWFPADVEQPHGRIIRQGNQNSEVAIEWYTTKGTYQSTMWQMVARKQRFIDQAFTGDKNMRSMDDMGEASLFEQAAAIASGDPRAIQLAGLKQDVIRFERLQAAHANEQIEVVSSMRYAEWGVEAAKKAIKLYTAAFKAAGEGYFSFKSGTIGGKAYEKVGEFGQAAKDAFNQVAKEAMESGQFSLQREIGSLSDNIKIMMYGYRDEKKGTLNGSFKLYVQVADLQLPVATDISLGADVDAVGLGRRIANQVNTIESSLSEERRNLTRNETDIARLTKKRGAPFEYQQEMAEKYGDLKRLEEELRLEGLEKPAAAPAPTVINEDGSTGGEPPVLFSRPTINTSTVGKNVNLAISSVEASRVVESVRAAFLAKTGSPLAVPIEKVRKFSDLPAALQAAAASQNVGDTPKGAFFEGKIYVVEESHTSAADLESTIFHELYGHAGTRSLFGGDWEAKQNALLDAIGGGAGIMRIAAARNIDLRAYMDGLAADPTMTDATKRAVIMDELLAHIAEKGMPFQQKIREFIGAARAWLRAHGFAELAQFGDTDLAHVLRQARRALGKVPMDSASGPGLFRLGGAMGDAIKNMTVTDVRNRTGNKLADYRGLGLQALGRRQLVDIYAADFKPAGKESILQQYSDLVQKMDADKNETGAQADGVADRWGKLPDQQQLAELMHDATLEQIDPAKPHQASDNQMKHAALQRRFNALTPEARAIYTEARDMYAAHYTKVKDEIKQRIMRAMPDNAARANMLTRMDAEFYGSIKGVYFPLARHGDYLVTVKNTAGDTLSVSSAETLNEAEATRRALLQQFPGQIVSKVLKRKEFNAARDSVSRGFLKQLFGVFDQYEQSAEFQEQINQLYLSSLPDLSWAKHGIHRKGTPGFSQDARRAFAKNMFHGARYLAKLKYSDRMTDKLDELQDHVDGKATDATYDSVKGQQVVDEMNKRHQSYMNPDTSELSTTLTSIGYLFYMGLSPASAMVNLTGTPLMAYPILGGRYGFGKAAKALLDASKLIVQGKNDVSKVLTGDRLKAYQDAVNAGVIDVTQAHDLAGIAAGNDQQLGGKMRVAMKWAGFMFHHVERYNRAATLVAGYDLARATGATHEAAYKAAVEDVYASQFDYSSGNRPRIMQGNVARVLLLFKQYATNMLYTLTRNAIKASKGDKVAQRTLAGLLVTHAIGAGVLGLPIVGTLLAAASAIGSDDDEPWDAKAALRNITADMIGQKPAEVLMHGFSRLTPFDLSGRVGLDKLLLPDVQEGLEGQRAAEAWMTAALGPVAGIGIGITKGMADISKGDYLRGLESMLPVAIRNGVKALRLNQEGVQDKTGVSILDETTGAEELGQLLGFSPSRSREAYEGKSSIYKADQMLLRRRQSLTTQWAQAKIAGDEDGVKEIWQDIQRYNEKNPSRRIKMPNLIASVRARKKRIAEAEQGVYLPKNRRDAMAAGAFAVAEQ